MAPYVYKPLTKPTRRDHAFRLLDILPCSAKDEPINVRLRHVRHEDKPQYECLSYCWGEMAQNHEVSIVSENDDDEQVGSIKIRDSLHGALARLRDTTKPRTIWADALCINQQDMEERSSQVSIMALIYWNSHKLIIWLGTDPDKQAAPAFEALKPISQATWGKTLKLTNEDVDKFDPVVWAGVGRLYDNPWFRRAWVQQEIGLSRSAAFYWGEAEPYGIHDLFGFDICADSQEGGKKAKQIYIRDATAVKSTRNIWLEYGQATQPGWKKGDEFHKFIKSTNFLNLLSKTFYCEATDPRDRIYAFLGHPSARKPDAYSDVESEDYMVTCGGNAAHAPIIIPDYSKTTEEVFLEVARKLFWQHKDLRPLGAVCHTEESLASGMPSWVPLWDNASPWFIPIGAWVSQWKDRVSLQNTEPVRIGHRELLVDGVVVATTTQCREWTDALVQETAQKIVPKGGWSKFGYRSRRLMCHTNDGLECLVPDVTKPGDEIAILVGGYSPFVIRHVSDSAYKIVGACIVCGWKDNELSRIAERYRHNLQQIVLV
ncbi:hypothetical protein CGLO_12286 [Colletotrichum gloeosporioides Cg-14]|uniref:Heterokaryon incompatibility domain-containing protein n=1 Tax=Colletotrichum gloeosporioides (strain Cg-14) TaxID=1237896 RepID=T0L9Z6_COLGC|nr:hypothetical protein CGLO_12286 [Colletotrichum gloeosporioides Cg-14]